MPRQPPTREPPASQFNLAVGKDGNPLPYSPEEVKTVATKAMVDGDLVCALFRLPSGDLSFQVFGPPSLELIEMMKGALSQYERVLGFLKPPKGKAS
jgi:hypothetical protein